jgi:hypothetical protein
MMTKELLISKIKQEDWSKIQHPECCGNLGDNLTTLLSTIPEERGDACQNVEHQLLPQFNFSEIVVQALPYLIAISQIFHAKDCAYELMCSVGSCCVTSGSYSPVTLSDIERKQREQCQMLYLQSVPQFLEDIQSDRLSAALKSDVLSVLDKVMTFFPQHKDTILERIERILKETHSEFQTELRNWMREYE